MSTEIAINPIEISSKELAALEKLLAVSLPSTQPDLEAWLHEQFAAGNQAALRFALGVTEAYRNFETPALWADWGQQAFGCDKKTMYNCLNCIDALRHHGKRIGGRPLLEAGSIVEKMALLGKLEPGEVEYFLSHHDLVEISRDAMRAAIKKIVDDRPENRTVEPPDSEGGEEKDNEKRHSGIRIETLLGKLAELDDDQVLELSEEISPAQTTAALAKVFDLLLTHLLSNPCWSEEQFEAEHGQLARRWDAWLQIKKRATEPNGGR